MTATPQKIVLLGANGQLGRDLSTRLLGEIVPLTRADVDLLDAAGLRAKIAELGPSIVINCAAYNFVDKAENEPEAAFAVNAFAILRLAEICRDLHATLVHFSTDYVFGLEAGRQTPYRERDIPGPLSVYAASKLTGEHFVQAICPKHVIIRTCGLYGRWGSGGKGTNFVETMLRLAAHGKSLRVVNDQVCAPSYTVDVAGAVVQLLTVPAHGLYHVTNAGQCSWYEFARVIFDLSGFTTDLSPTTSREYGAKARRPSYSALTSEREETPRLRPWREALAAYLRERAS